MRQLNNEFNSHGQFFNYQSNLILSKHMISLVIIWELILYFNTKFYHDNWLGNWERTKNHYLDCTASYNFQLHILQVMLEALNFALNCALMTELLLVCMQTQKLNENCHISSQLLPMVLTMVWQGAIVPDYLTLLPHLFPQRDTHFELFFTNICTFTRPLQCYFFVLTIKFLLLSQTKFSKKINTLHYLIFDVLWITSTDCYPVWTFKIFLNFEWKIVMLTMKISNDSF